MANCKRKRTIAAIMALAIVAGAAPVNSLSDLIMPELGVSAAEATKPVDIINRNVTLGGTIGVNFLVAIEEDYDFYNTAYVKITCGDTVVKTLLSAGRDYAEGQKLFTINLAAKQMADTVTCEVFKNSSATEAEDTFTTSVKEYGEAAIKAYSSNTALVNVVKSMLNYGAYAQKQFNHNTSKLANAGLAEADKAVSSVTADTLAGYGFEYVTKDLDIIDDATGTIQIATTLQSETELNILVKLEGSYNAKNIAVTCTDGAIDYATDVSVYDAGTEDDYAYIKIKGIAAKALSKDLIVTVAGTGASTDKAVFKCSALTYARTALNSSSTSTALKNLNRAFYLYNQAAVAYFNAERKITTEFEGIAAKYTEFAVQPGKAFLETVKENNEDVEKFVIVVPATFADGYGVGEAELSYIKNDEQTVISTDDYSVNYNSTNGITSIIVDKDAIPSGVKVNVDIKVSQKIGFSAYELDENTDKYVESTAATATVKFSNTGVFYGEQFETTMSTVNPENALPGEIKIFNAVAPINGDGDIDATELVLNKDYTYDAKSGKIVVYAPAVENKITIIASAVASHNLITNFTNIAAVNELPATVGSGFTAEIKVTDKNKYMIPDELTVYGLSNDSDDEAAGYYSVLNKDGVTRTYYNAGEEAIEANEVSPTYAPGVTAATATAEQKEAAQLTKIKADNTGDNCYYIIDMNGDGTATVTVQNITGDDIVLVVRADEYVGITYSIDDTLLYSAKEITYDAKNKKFVTEDPETTALKGENVDEIYVALNSTTATDLDIPSQIKVTMNGVELKAEEAGGTAGYTWVPVTNASNSVENYKLTINKTVTGPVEITAAATEMFTLTPSLGAGLVLKYEGNALTNGTAEEISVGPLELVLDTTTSAYELPGAITIKNNGTTLSGEYDYYYDSTTGKITVYDVAKGDKLVVSATAAKLHTITWNSGSNVSLKFESQQVLSGYNAVATVTVPEWNDGDNDATNDRVISISDITITMGTTPLTNDSTKDSYYVYDEVTGKLTIVNVTGNVDIQIEAKTEYNLVMKNASTTEGLLLKGVTYEAKDVTIHEGKAFTAEIEVSGLSAGTDLDEKVYIGKTDANNATNALTSDYTFEKSKTKENVYVLTIDGAAAAAIDDDVYVVFAGVIASYDVDFTAANVSAADYVGIPIADLTDEVNYSGSYTVKVAPISEEYKLPANATVKVGGTVVAGAYALDYKTNADGTKDYSDGTATITLENVTGDIEIEIIPEVAVLEDATTTTGLSNADVKLKVGAKDITSSVTADTYFYNPASTSALAIDVTLEGTNAYQYKLNVAGLEVYCGDPTESANKVQTKVAYTAAVAAAQKAYDDAGASDKATALVTLNAEKAKPYYEFDGTTVTVNNVTGYVTVKPTVTPVSPVTIEYDAANDGTPDADGTDVTKTGTAKGYLITYNGQQALRIDNYVALNIAADTKITLADATGDVIKGAALVAVDTNNDGDMADAEDYYIITGLSNWTAAITIVNQNQTVTFEDDNSKITVTSGNKNVTTTGATVTYGSTNNVFTIDVDSAYEITAVTADSVNVVLSTDTNASTADATWDATTCTLTIKKAIAGPITVTVTTAEK